MVSHLEGTRVSTLQYFFSRDCARKKKILRGTFFFLQMRTVRLTRIADADSPNNADSRCGHMQYADSSQTLFESGPMNSPQTIHDGDRQLSR